MSLQVTQTCIVQQHMVICRSLAVLFLLAMQLDLQAWLTHVTHIACKLCKRQLTLISKSSNNMAGNALQAVVLQVGCHRALLPLPLENAVRADPPSRVIPAPLLLSIPVQAQYHLVVMGVSCGS